MIFYLTMSITESCKKAMQIDKLTRKKIMTISNRCFFSSYIHIMYITVFLQYLCIFICHMPMNYSMYARIAILNVTTLSRGIHSMVWYDCNVIEFQSFTSRKWFNNKEEKWENRNYWCEGYTSKRITEALSLWNTVSCNLRCTIPTLLLKPIHVFFAELIWLYWIDTGSENYEFLQAVLYRLQRPSIVLCLYFSTPSLVFC